VTSLSLGSVHTDFITISSDNNAIYVFNLNEKSKDTFLITLSSINCDVIFNRVDQSGNKIKALSKQDRTSQEIVKGADIADGFIRYSYVVDKTDSKSLQDIGGKCLLHLSGIKAHEELLLNENIPHQVTLGKEVMSFNYIYPQVSQEDSFVLSIFYDKGSNYNLNVYVSFKSKVTSAIDNKLIDYKMKLYQTNQDHLLIDKNKLKDNCPVFPCYIHMFVFIEKRQNNLATEDLTYRILATSLTKKPIYLPINKITESTQPSGIYQYYYTDVSKGQKGEISIKTKSGTIKAFARIVSKDAPVEPDYDYENVRLPSSDFFQLKLDDKKGSISFTEKETNGCGSTGCSFYLAILTDKYESFNEYLISYSITLRVDAVQIKLGVESIGVLVNDNDINYYSITVDKESDELVILTEHLNHVKLLINLNEGTNTVLPVSGNSNWEINLSSREEDPKFKERFVIKTSEGLLKSKSITNLKEKSFTIGIQSLLKVDNFYSFNTNTGNANTKEPSVLAYGSYTPCSTDKDDDTCLYVIYNIENQDNLLLYAKQNEHHNSSLKVNIYASIVTKADYHDDKYPKALENFKYNSKGLVGGEYLTINGSDLSDYKDKVIVIAIHSNKATSITLFASLHQVSLTVQHIPIIGKSYLVYLDKMKKSEFKFTSDNYIVDIERVLGEGNFEISGNSDYFFNISRHRKQYRIVFDASDKIFFSTDDIVAFFVIYKNMNNNDFNIHFGEAYHYVMLGVGFPLRFRFPLIQDIRSDLAFNINVEKAIFDKNDNSDDGKELDLKLTYSDDEQRVKNITWIGDYVKANQNGNILIKNPTNSGMANNNRTGFINIEEASGSNNIYDVLILNIVLFPIHDAQIALPKNKYINSKLIDTSPIVYNSKDDYFNRHVYKLSRDHSLETFFLIEISSCLGQVDHFVGEVVNAEVRNVTKHEYKRIDRYGKSLIELRLAKADAEAFLIITPKSSVFIDNFYTISYVVRYNSYIDDTEYDVYNLNNQGQVVFSDLGSNFEFNWGSVTTKDDNNNDTLLKSKFIVKLIQNSNNDEMNNIDSICYSHNIDKYYKKKSSHIMNGESILINKNEITEGQRYFVTILAKTDETRDHTLLAYNPVELLLGEEKKEDLFTIWVIGNINFNF
jgi:hypothetical protein